ncbi:MAG: flavodoxin domain-containing protein [Candidatus Heimdallarchaeota archaeon]
MPSTKVLITYGSRYGCTKEISHELAKLLEEEGSQTQQLDLRTAREDKWPSIAEYNGVVIGTGIRVGYWTKETKKFLKESSWRFRELWLCCRPQDVLKSQGRIHRTNFI